MSGRYMGFSNFGDMFNYSSKELDNDPHHPTMVRVKFGIGRRPFVRMSWDPSVLIEAGDSVNVIVQLERKPGLFKVVYTMTAVGCWHNIRDFFNSPITEFLRSLPILPSRRPHG